MILRIATITIVYFLLGAFVTLLMQLKNRKIPFQKEIWVKYGMYLLVVGLMLFGIYFGQLKFLGIGIVAISWFEIIRISSFDSGINYTSTVLALAVFCIISLLFLLFSAFTPVNLQLYAYTVVFAFDGFSQIIGQLAGKTKIFPKTSPNKTLEGAVGGFFAGLITSLSLSTFLDYSHGKAFIIGLLICITAQGGDLLASKYKRKCSVKDYGHSLPGHGGFLDRFDSFILVGCFFGMQFIIEFITH